MPDNVERPRSRSQRVGSAILLVISVLLIMGGLSWFSSGPTVNVSFTAEVSGMTAEEYRVVYPEAAKHLTRNARQMAAWFAALGWMALVASREGFRHGTRWAWQATWAVPGVLLAIGLIYTVGVGALAFDNLGFGSLGVVALVGQLLARPRGPKEAEMSGVVQPAESR